MRLINFVDPIDMWVATCFLSKQQVLYDSDSKEYWLNLHVSTTQEINFLIEEKKANKIVFYDILHAESRMQDWCAPLIKKTSEKI
jgi:hypothetical protein